MGPKTTGPVWPALTIGLVGLAVVLIASYVVTRRVVLGRATQRRHLVIDGLDRGRSLARVRWPRGGTAALAIVAALVGAGVACAVTFALGELTKQRVVIDADRPVYHFFLRHRQEWLSTPLSWATHVGEYPEMAAIALAGAVVIGFRIPRFRVLLTIVLTAGFIPLMLAAGHAYNWIDGGAFAAFLIAAAALRSQPLLLSALLMATMPVEKHLQSWVTTALHGGVPPASDAVGGVGPFPSGGCTRIVIVCGLVGYLLAREYRSSRMSIGIGVGVVAIAYFEGFTRIYLGKHWFVDCLGGLFFGTALLVVMIAGLRAYLGPVKVDEADRLDEPARLPVFRVREAS